MAKAFVGEKVFLSNFYEAPVTLGGLTYRCAEAAFQAQKAAPEARARYTQMTGAEARRAGKRETIDIVQWNANRIRIMRQVLWAKFVGNPYLGALLMNLDGDIVEVNEHRDRYWGQCPAGVGANHLGDQLMRLHTYLQTQCGAKSHRRSPVAGAIYCGRGSIWGNPYPMTNPSEAERQRVVQAYSQHLLSSPELMSQVATLKGQTLECFCAPKLCHTDVLRIVANCWRF